jgi:hypothetical protein
MRRLAIAFAILFASACYETPRPDCAFVCGPEQECPEGYSCDEGYCKKDTAPESLECGDPLVDAAPDDEADAGLDAATPDAGEE